MKKCRILLKTISIILSVIIVLQILPFSVIAANIKETKKLESAQVSEESSVKSEPAEILLETEEKTNEYTKTFNRKDGTKVDIISTTPIHYYDEDGTLKDIDNTLEKTTINEEDVWQNKANSFTVSLPDKLGSDNNISIANNSYKLNFKLSGVSTEKSSEIIDNKPVQLTADETAVSIEDNISKIKYEDVFDDTDIEYLVIENGLKENIIFNSAPDMGYALSFSFSAPGMSWELNQDNSISFYNADREETFTILSPYMYDNSGNTSNDIQVNIYRSRTGNLITYLPSTAWLEDKSRVYPVVLDPTVVTYSRSHIVNACVGNYTGDTTSYMYVQKYTENETAYNSQMLLNIENSLLLGERIITDATVALYCAPLSIDNGFTNTIGLSLVNEEWSTETTAIPQSSNDYIDAHTIATAGTYTFDITEAFNMWNIGVTNNYGFAIKPITDSGEYCNVKIGNEDGLSSKRPLFTINYKLAYGLDEDFEFHSIDMGRAGTAYVNDITNTLVVVREELGLAGNLMPVNLCRIYDSALYNSSGFSWTRGDGAGTNWQWNYYGRLIYSSGVHRYIGADGKWLYFNLEETLEDGTQKYVSPDGEKTVLWIESDASSLSDFSNMYFEDEEYQYRFTSDGRINKIINKQNDSSLQISFAYSSTIGKITDGAGREIRLTIPDPYSTPRTVSEIGAYTSSGERITVTPNGSQTASNISVTYTYDTTTPEVPLFKTATYADGETVRYEYDSNNNLILIENIDQSRLEIEYTNGRVSAYTKRVYDADNNQYLFDQRVEFDIISPYERVYTEYDGDENTPSYTQTVYYDKNYEIRSTFDSENEGSATYYYSDGELKASVSSDEGTNLLASQTLTNATAESQAKLNINNARPIDGATGETVYSVSASPLDLSRAYSQIDVSSLTDGENDVTFNTEVWLKAPFAAHTNDTRFSGIMLSAFDSEGNETVSASYAIDTSIAGWQYMLCCITVPAGTEYINLHVLNDYQVSPLYFAGLEFYESDFSFYFDANDIDVEENGTMEPATCVCGSACEYGEGCPCTCTSAADCVCVCCHATTTTNYDSAGNLIYSATSDGSKTISETYTYTEDKNFLATASDSLGNTVEYSYNTLNGTLTSFKDAEDNTVNYSYDAMLGLAYVSQAVSNEYYGGEPFTISNTYGYTDDRLTSISTGNGVNYSFTYDPFGNQKTVKVGNQTLASYSYGTGANRSQMNSVTFGNGQVVSYTYDTDGNITAIECDSAHSGYEYTYTYAGGELSSATDRKTGFVTTYGETTYTVKNSSGNVVYQSSYDEDDNFVETANGYVFTYDYAELTNGGYSETTGKTTSAFTVGNGTDALTQTSVTDYFGRKESTVTRFGGWEDANKITTNYSYKSVGNNTSEIPESISAVINPVSGHARSFTWEYTYDANGNITSETVPGSIDRTDYYYDEAGQLLEAVNLTWDTYTEYDNGGNVTYKYIIWTDSTGENGIEEEYIFEYGNENWPDQLTKVNDKPITYDAIGNPLTYDGKTYTWTAGRELASIATADMSLAFKYNDSGLRTHKTVTQNGVTATYTYAWSQDGRLISQTDGTTTLHFIYDENDEIIGFAKLTADSSEMYYYVKNLQGDVYAIVNSNGTVVAEYLYDAWGYLLEITGSQADTLGILNPIRYRGYYYDTETGYYYLQSRYYDPLWGRFINADSYIKIGFYYSTANMMPYCNNNPIIYTDPTGHMSVTLLNNMVDVTNSSIFDDSQIAVLVLLLNGKNLYTAFHELAQLFIARKLKAKGYINIQLEKIFSKKEIDIVATKNSKNYLWEVKPLGTDASKQVKEYCKLSGYSKGKNIGTIEIILFKHLKMKITFDNNGGAFYSFYLNLKKVKNTELSKILKKALLTATIAVGAIAITTLTDNLITGGTGVVNDIPMLMGGLTMAIQIFVKSLSKAII
ncbi:MAG: RHS repeat protein [Clostridia bacterium]|nr:RHS repeat protein [Clostridia bacterium]